MTDDSNAVQSYEVYTVHLLLREGTSPKRAVQVLKRWARRYGYSVGCAEIKLGYLAAFDRIVLRIRGEYVKAIVPQFREATAEQLLSGELIKGDADWRKVVLNYFG